MYDILWYIYLHLVVFTVNVAKYTIRDGCYGFWAIIGSSWIIIFFVTCWDVQKSQTFGGKEFRWQTKALRPRPERHRVNATICRMQHCLHSHDCHPSIQKKKRECIYPSTYQGHPEIQRFKSYRHIQILKLKSYKYPNLKQAIKS